jgi:hypothetical protein
MKYLILLLAIPFFSVEAAAPNCEKLKQIANDLEKKIQSKRFPAETCAQMDPVSLGLLPDSIGFPKVLPPLNGPTKVDKKIAAAWDYRCKDLSAIELQLKSIENEIALLKGIDSLKSEINSGKSVIGNFNNQTGAKEASATFMKNLEVARSLEIFLATNNTKSENILGKIATDPDWKEDTDIKGFGLLLERYCGGFPQKGTVCEKGFLGLTEDTFKELKDFVTIGANTERKFNKNQIKDLTEAMTIKKGEDAYSFAKLAGELKGIQANGMLSAEDIQKLKELPNLSNDKSRDFLKQMTGSINVMKDAEQFVKADATPARFASVLTDLKNRQEWEMKSKLSLVLNQYNDFIPAEAADKCLDARALKGSIRECLNPLKTSAGLKSFEQSAVEDLIAEFEYSEKQVAKLDKMISTCIPQKDLTYPAECEGIVTQQMADLVAKAQVLTTLRAKHIQASPDLITFRNFALEKLHSGECMTSGESNISDCYTDLGSISREAITLSGETNDIIYVYKKPKEDTAVTQLCLESVEVVPFKEALCALKDEDPSKKSGKKLLPTYDAPVSPNDPNSMGKALMDLGSSILGSVAGYMAPPMNRVNPYAQPSFPYTMPPARDSLDYIKSSYPNFGSYQLTPGAMPYSSMNSNAASSSYNFGGSTHFNTPVGYGS